MRRFLLAASSMALLCGATPDPQHAPADYAADAKALDGIIAANYAYLDRFDGKVPTSAVLEAERDAVKSDDDLLHYAEDKLAALADHHAITGSSFHDDWGLVPSYADVWITVDKAGYRIESVKAGSPAAGAHIVAGDRLVAVDGLPVDQAVAAFWQRLGFTNVRDPERRAYAARVLAAGRRDRPRALTVRHGAVPRTLSLPNLYAARPGDRPPVSLTRTKTIATIRFNDSLGRNETIAAFDEAMAKVRPGSKLVIDLTDTGSGGDTTIARAVMGWFVDRPRFYQMHRLVAEERETGVVRQWVEQVSPRAGKHFAGRPQVHVGRWTGSMGEGMAIGFMAIGVPVCGGPMAGLRGAVYDFTLPATGLTVKLPAERVYTPTGIARETVVPPRCK